MQFHIFVMYSSVFTYVVLFILHQFADGAIPCSPRDFGKGGTVCVCNATYCDTIEPPTRVPQGQFLLYSSSMDGLRMKKLIKTFSTTMTQTGGATYKVNVNQTYQTIFGFGTAFTDAAGINFVNLQPGAQENLLRSYFSPDGIELNFGRVPIGGTDFSTHPYTYDDHHENDNNLSHFNLTMEDFTYKIPILKRAQAMSARPIQLLAAAWSPPVWMKTNKEIAGYGFLQEKYYQLWADYHTKFLDEYKKHGLKFWGMSTGNEPLNGIIPIKGINALGWTPFTQRTWIAKHMGPTLRASQHNKTNLLAMDDQRFFLPWWIQLDLNHWVTGWIDWNYALNMKGGPVWIDNYVDAPVIVNEKEGEFYKQPMFYGLGHFSKFILDGSKRVQLLRQRNGETRRLEIVAFMQPDQAVVVVIFNG
ncbi:hypothetical protein B566_EDAN004142 [Ephemera danica]|nr:hypothetical protein B566_EDAN004142 [Ephemera danica]